MLGMNLLKSEVLKEYRQKNFITQQELADLLGVTIQTVNRWEGGETMPSLKNLKKIVELIEKRKKD